MIPTAEEAVTEWQNKALKALEGKEPEAPLELAFIKFAKLHVEAALKAAATNAKTEKRTRGSQYAGDWKVEVNRESILTAYPLENIK